MAVEKQIKNGFILTIINLVLVSFIFVQSCTMNRKVSRLEKEVNSISTVQDTLMVNVNTLESVIVTEDELDAKLDENMLEFLIYEDDVDKGKVSLGQIKLLIREKKEK